MISTRQIDTAHLDSNFTIGTYPFRSIFTWFSCSHSGNIPNQDKIFFYKSFAEILFYREIGKHWRGSTEDLVSLDERETLLPHVY